MCNYYGSGGKRACSIHYIDYKTLEMLLLMDIQCKAMLAQNSPTTLKERIMAQEIAASQEQMNTLRAALTALDKHLVLVVGQAGIVQLREQGERFRPRSRLRPAHEPLRGRA